MDARQYLISFLATLKGHKAVVGGLTQMQKGTKGYGTATVKTGKQTKDFSQILGNLTSRALLTIPVWLLLRSVMMGFIRIVGDMIRANLDLEEGMARIKTVVHGTAQEIEANMIVIKRAILDVAVKSRVPIKELAEAYYFLQTSSLSAEEAMSAFIPTINAMVGTGNKAKDTARALAGMYNTVGKFMEEGMTITEKFVKISDVLTYTYATQDVQLQELIQSYTKLAPYLGGLSDGFTEIVTMLGFLNTRLLRAGRTGRLTGRAILQLTKNARHLSSVFGIAFDPDQPINFLKVIEAIAKATNQTTKLTARQGQAIQKVFATRAGVAVRLLVTHFEELQEEIKLATENADGFAQKMQEIRMGTITAQMARMKNIFAILLNDFISGVYGAGDFAEALKGINDGLEALRLPLTRTGQLIGWLAQILSISALSFEALVRHNVNFNEEANKMKLWLPTWREFLNVQEESIKKSEEKAELLKTSKKLEEEVTKVRLNSLKIEKQGIKHTTNLLKIYGANQLDIARYRLESLENLRDLTTEEEYELELTKVQDGLLEAQVKYRKEMLGVLQKAQLDVLKASGKSEWEILNIKGQQLQADRLIIGEEEYMVRLVKLKVQQATAFQQLKQKELTTATNIYRQYAKANEEERRQIERMMELVKLTPGELGRAILDEGDFAIIDDYWKYFNEKQREAMGEALRREFQLDRFVSPEAWEARTKALDEYKKKYWDWIRKGAPKGERPAEPFELAEVDIETSTEKFRQIFTRDIPKEFWANWLEEGSRATAKQKEEEFYREQGLVKKRPGVWEAQDYKGDFAEREKIKRMFKEKFDITVNIEAIDISIPSADEISEKATEKFKEKLKEQIDEKDIARRIDEALRGLQ